MRALALFVGLMGVAGAVSAEQLAHGADGSDAVTGQFVYEMRFGGERAAPASSFQLRFGSEQQVLNQRHLPLRAEYRLDTGAMLVNGLDVTPMLVNRQAEEGGMFSALGGWIPLLIVLSAAGFILVDGNDLDNGDFFGSGGSGL
jgi:hypothetical protein